MDRYHATYTDVHGSETTTIDNDGRTLRLLLRGVEFTGNDFDSFEPTGAAPDQLQRFTLHDGCLSSCRFQCLIPIPIHDRDRMSPGFLSVDYVLGDLAPDGFPDEQLRIALEYDGKRYLGPGTSGWFEDELLAIQSQLPETIFMKACINCLYSDYSPYGHALFGDMMCFRNQKEEYLRVTTKQELWSVRCERVVQETYLCPEFERRIPGTGYRG